MESRIVLLALALSILLTACCAQPKSSYLSVGEDYGKSWLSNFQANNPKPVENTSSGLWNWGSAPKGRVISNGKLTADPYYIWKSFNFTSGWLGEAYKDSATGNAVYAYINPYTGSPVYFYVDPKTGKPVYTSPGNATSIPAYGTNPLYSGSANYYNGIDQGNYYSGNDLGMLI